MTNQTPTRDERTSLIAAIFLDNDQVEMVERLSGGDAQAFIDRVDDVSPHAISRSKGKSIDINANPTFCSLVIGRSRTRGPQGLRAVFIQHL